RGDDGVDLRIAVMAGALVRLQSNEGSLDRRQPSRYVIVGHRDAIPPGNKYGEERPGYPDDTVPGKLREHTVHSAKIECRFAAAALLTLFVDIGIGIAGDLRNDVDGAKEVSTECFKR